MLVRKAYTLSIGSLSLWAVKPARVLLTNTSGTAVLWHHQGKQARTLPAAILGVQSHLVKLVP
jgi:hypothetical protein